MKCSMVRKQQLESYFEDVLEIGGCVSDLNFGNNDAYSKNG